MKQRFRRAIHILTQDVTNDFFVFYFLKFNLCVLGTASGNGTHSPFTFKYPISLRAGNNEIALLSLTVGLPVSQLHCLELEHSFFL